MTHEADQPIEWLRCDAPASDVVITSRVRLARNFAGFPFTGRADTSERAQILRIAQSQILDADLAPKVMWVDITELSDTERRVLVERHLISSNHAEGDQPRAVAVSSPDERLAIMVNEEDHLRIQVIRAGLDLTDAFEQANTADDKIESRADFAFSPRFGYLTACPTNVGTGLRVSAMLHLPALRLTGDLEKVKRAAKGMNLAVRGFFGEGSEAAGDLYQISNQTTLGRSEREILQQFEQVVVPRIMEFERSARLTLAQKRPYFFEDQIFRALAILRSARLMKIEEAMTLLGVVRLGIVSSLINDVPLATLHNLILNVQTAHLQRTHKRNMSQRERRIERAALIRNALKEPNHG
ncbi:MAG: protein arginine kinase [Phycisphaeraceae bacterium]|nr:protein arginine kinase [Phycisphaerales bacterium]MCB9844012.1 protein arginine kinase [Phycisphaeraceae bacterium]